MIPIFLHNVNTTKLVTSDNNHMTIEPLSNDNHRIIDF